MVLKVVDKQAREDICLALEQFMLGKINNFELDNKIQKIETKDETVKNVSHLLWYFYDDLIEHGVDDFDKSSWDYLNRIRLLLKSDATLERKTLYKLPQLFVILIWIVSFLADAFSNFSPLFIYSFAILISGFYSWRLYFWESEKSSKAQTEPFKSFGDLKRARKAITDFKKIRFQQKSLKEYHPPIILKILSSMIFVIVAPFLLIFPEIDFQVSPKEGSKNRN